MTVRHKDNCIDAVKNCLADRAKVYLRFVSIHDNQFAIYNFDFLNSSAGLTHVAFVAFIAFLADEGNQPFFQASFESVFYGKLISGLTIRTVCACRAGFSDERSEPFCQSTLISVLDSKLIRRLAIRACGTRSACVAFVTLITFLADKGDKPIFQTAFKAIFHGKLISGLTIRTVCTCRAGFSDERSEPFCQSTLISVLDSKLIRRLAIRACGTRSACVAFVTLITFLADKGDKPIFQTAFKAIFHGKLISGLTIRTVCTCRAGFSDERSEPLRQRTLIPVLDSKLIGGLTVRACSTRSTSVAFVTLITFLADKRNKPIFQTAFKPVLHRKLIRRLAI